MVLESIDRDIYEKVVIKLDQPSFLCFFKNTLAHGETVVSIQELSQQFGSIRFYAAQEEEHEFFSEKFHFLGTPIFIFLDNGIERGRLLGSVSTDRLRAFIENNIRMLTPR